jgi:hypothetical protein
LLRAVLGLSARTQRKGNKGDEEDERLCHHILHATALRAARRPRRLCLHRSGDRDGAGST